MQNEKNSSFISNLLIDLTPLLDVVLIILVVILANQKTAGQTYKAAEDLLKDKDTEIASIYSDLTAAQMQNEEYEEIYSYVNVLTIYSSYNPYNRKERVIHVLINGEPDWTRDLYPSNEDLVWSECKEYIESKLSEYSDKPTVFAISSETMLYRDEIRIISLYDNLEGVDTYRYDASETDDE